MSQWISHCIREITIFVWPASLITFLYDGHFVPLFGLVTVNNKIAKTVGKILFKEQHVKIWLPKLGKPKMWLISYQVLSPQYHAYITRYVHQEVPQETNVKGSSSYTCTMTSHIIPVSLLRGTRNLVKLWLTQNTRNQTTWPWQRRQAQKQGDRAQQGLEVMGKNKPTGQHAAAMNSPESG